MYVFIDESGIHVQSGHSSVALVYIAVPDIDNVNTIVLDAEKKLRIQSFHWAKHNWQIRKKFFEHTLPANFEVKAAILLSPFTEEKFEEVIEYLLVAKGVKQMIIDGSKTKSFERRLKKALRDKDISVKKLRMGNDKSFPGLRLADAYAGLIRTYWVEPNNQKVKEIYKVVNHKITAQLVGGQAFG